MRSAITYCHPASWEWSEFAGNEDRPFTGRIAAADIEHPKHGSSPGQRKRYKRGLSAWLLRMSTSFDSRGIEGQSAN
jgi:hypothetical protein